MLKGLVINSQKNYPDAYQKQKYETKSGNYN